ncbi:MAG: hypothetical protein ACRCYS_16005 [Beijerinckiaceae bacterium]
MTCIVGVWENGKVTIGADSMSVSKNGYHMMRADKKIFQRGPFIIGYTTSYRFGQLLQYSMTLPDHPPEMSDHEFMVVRFVEQMRIALRDGGSLKKENDVEDGGNLLVGYKGQVFDIFADFQVGLSAFGYSACGSGADAALGAMSALQGRGLDHREMITAALKAATFWQPDSVSEPFHILSSDCQEPVKIRRALG